MINFKLLTRPVFASIFFTLMISTGYTAKTSPHPAVRVENIRRAFSNGEHNAFTDLISWKGKFYLTFRTCPDGHGVHPTSSIIVLSSTDAKTWEKAFQFSVPKRDVRDSHFLIFKDKLFVYTGAWWCGKEHSPRNYEINEHLGFGVWTKDGKTWSGPHMLEGTYGHYIWKAAAHDGKAYLIGRRKKWFVASSSRAERDALLEAALMVSEDGLIWKHQGLFREKYGDETAFLFKPDASILAVGRSGGNRNAMVMRSKPPYKDWDRVELDRYIGGPLLSKWGNRYLVGGRKTINKKARTSLYWLENDKLHEFAELPSDGDNSYPGFVEINKKQGLISWYSSHEKNDKGKTITAIYLADLHIEPDAKEQKKKTVRLKQEKLTIDGHSAFLILPDQVKPEGRIPWVWYAPTLKHIPSEEDEWIFKKCLEKGIAIAGVNVGESYGSPDGRAIYSAFYKELVENRNFSKRACLLARSRGGLMLYNWAVENPESVAGIAGIYPVCNLTSYPGLERACGAYNLTSDQLKEKLTEHNPIDRLEPLAKANVPIFHIHGDIDKVVPIELNSGELEKRYLKLGGKMTLKIFKGQGHNKWEGWFQCDDLTDFIIAHAK